VAQPKKPAEAGRSHPVHLRFPTDVFERLTAKAKAFGIPINRVVINEAAQYPTLERVAHLGESVRHMDNLLARYGSRFIQTELSEQLLAAVDEIIAAQTSAERDAPIDKLRIFRSAMLRDKREATKLEREELVARIALLERQLAAIEALPESSLDRDEIPGRRRIIADLKRAVALNAPTRREAAE
jgi:hypothetical protein